MSRLNYATALAALMAVTATPVLAQNHDMTGHAMSNIDMTGMDMSSPHDTSWKVMSHTVLNLVADHQYGPRGGSKNFVGGMTMIMATHGLNDSTDLDLDLMLSPDPLMGKGGYPLLLQTGETADGEHHLIDAQHPHDLFMAITATLTHRFDAETRGFLKLGWPGEFGFGPVAFMHRASGENFPLAPISHHWLDSGHITMGVITAGLTKGPLQFEVTQFTGREPDQHRYNLDRPRLDSTALRATWIISSHLTAQASWAHHISPEQLHPDEDLLRQSLSFAYSREFAFGSLYSTLAYGRKQIDQKSPICSPPSQSECEDKPDDAYLFENTFKFNKRWMALGRFERVYNGELSSKAYWVAKTEIGAIRTFSIGQDMTLGIGLVRQFNKVPDALKATYGDNPSGTVGFLQLKIHPINPGMKM